VLESFVGSGRGKCSDLVYVRFGRGYRRGIPDLLLRVRRVHGLLVSMTAQGSLGGKSLGCQVYKHSPMRQLGNDFPNPWYVGVEWVL
jgi:hypothetical protein